MHQKDELASWLQFDLAQPCSITAPAVSSTLYTDASQDYIGVYFQGQTLSEPFPDCFKSSHINTKELYAVDRGLEYFSSQLEHQVVSLRIDNNTALCAVRKEGSTKNWEINCLAVRIANRCLNLGLTVVPIRITSEENLLADSASRQKALTDWKLHTTLARRIFCKLGWPDVDLFATAASAQVPAYYTWSIEDVYARGVDSLAPDLDWNQHRLPYAFPPFSLVSLTLQKVLDQKVDRMILVCPYWPSKPYFTVLSRIVPLALRAL